MIINGTSIGEILTDLIDLGGIVRDPRTDDVVNGFGGDDSIFLHFGNDVANGGDGNDTIRDYGGGNDTMNGGNGNDRFYAGTGANTINGGEGTDTVSYRDSAIPAIVNLGLGFGEASGSDRLISVESAEGSRFGDRIIGSESSNTLSGGDGSDTLEGLGGDDLLWGGMGDDALSGGQGIDYLIGDAGDDVLSGGSEGDRLFGGAGSDGLYGDQGNDRLDGGAGQDRLRGGVGSDTMTGGTEADTFVFMALAAGERDTITDFQRGQDKIDLSIIDARPDRAFNQAFTFGGQYVDWDFSSTGPTGPGFRADIKAGEVEYFHSGGKTYVVVSQDGATEYIPIVLNGTHNLAASDFIL
jgi:Ca2+-binding RTX toxin-like protein